MQVCPSRGECLGCRWERKGRQCRCVGCGGEELTGCPGLTPGTHHPGDLCPRPSYTAPSWLHRHPSWNPTTMNNDLTLLTLGSPAQYTMCISPVCLASSNEALPEGLTWPAGCLSGVGRNLGQKSGWKGRVGVSHLGPNHPRPAHRQCDSGTPAVASSAPGHREMVPAVLGLMHHQLHDRCRGLLVPGERWTPDLFSALSCGTPTPHEDFSPLLPPG